MLSRQCNLINGKGRSVLDRLHQAIGHSMDDARITRALSLCKKVVCSFSYSCNKENWLMSKCSWVFQVTNLPQKLPRLLLIERVLEHKRALSKVLSVDMKTRPFVPTCQDRGSGGSAESSKTSSGFH
ncbi:hypothetical protein AMECASPLE_039144 [Ameca splendens]|uniref:Uncharacterized protein n=1 Tax=Ameca splendens TaxID=208324 RepID=A0ABV0Y8M5_9TELE